MSYVSVEQMTQLIQTLNELTSRLDVLAGMANAGAPALRTIPIASVSTAVTGSITAAVSTQGGYPAWVVPTAQNNLLVELGNINNITIAP